MSAYTLSPVMRTYHPSPTVLAPRVPLYQRGWLGAGTPGAGGAQIIGASSAVAATAATTLLPGSALVTSGLLAANMVPLIGTGIAVLGGIIAGLWAKHAARVAGAKDENSAINSAVSTFDSVVKAIFSAANSTDPSTNISAAQAAAQCQQLMQTFWQQMAPHMSGPGRADSSNMGSNCGQVNSADPCSGMIGGHKCDKNCTAGCCVGCQDLVPTVAQAVAVFQAGGGSVKVCTVYGSKYGAAQRSGYTLTYKQPMMNSVTGEISSALGGSLGGSVGGVPLWALAAAGLAAFALLR